MMAPTTATELRARCDGWPEDVVHDAVVAALKEARPAMLDAAGFVACWLTDHDLPPAKVDDPPPLPPELVATIWRGLSGGGFKWRC